MGRLDLTPYIKNYKSSFKYDPKSGQIIKCEELGENNLHIAKEEKINTKEKILMWLDFYIFSRFRKWKNY